MPNRHYENSQEDFYVECGVCTSCGAPQAEAPDLIDHSQADYGHCYFKKQPVTDDEIERAINAIAVSCVGGLRYGGTNEKILKRLYEMGAGDQCDHKPSDIQQPLTTQSQSASKQQSHSYLHVFLRNYLIRSIIILMIIVILVYFCSIL